MHLSLPAAALLCVTLLTACSPSLKDTVLVDRQPDPSLLVPCAPIDQMSPNPTDNEVAKWMVDTTMKALTCSDKFDALAGFVKAGAAK
jgi:hypothetical protein